MKKEEQRNTYRIRWFFASLSIPEVATNFYGTRSEAEEYAERRSKLYEEYKNHVTKITIRKAYYK